MRIIIIIYIIMYTALLALLIIVAPLRTTLSFTLNPPFTGKLIKTYLSHGTWLWRLQATLPTKMVRNSNSVAEKPRHYSVAATNKVLCTTRDRFCGNHGANYVAYSCSPSGFGTVEPTFLIHMEYCIPYNTRIRGIILYNPKG